MNCHRCQATNPDDAVTCQQCGAELATACEQCGAGLPSDALFCHKCGSPVGQAQVEAQKRLEQYIPAELLTKLESARTGGGMQGERRIVSMLFCDVKGSSAAAEKLDPEEWAQIMNGAFRLLIEPVYRYEGTLARLMGDAILAFFGAPIAHEDDSQRAVLAGLDILTGIAPYRKQVLDRWGLDFNVRIGINTGLVVVGEVGSDLRVEYTALGDAVNLAARMEETAEPGTVHISEHTQRLVAPVFDLEHRGRLAVRGKDETVDAYRVIARKSEPASPRGLEEKGISSALVGRQAEMEVLRASVTGLLDGRGSITFVIGEAGLGKSRLVREVKDATESVSVPVK